MATHDYIISNASGAAVRADLNNALAAIASNNSSATAPTTTYAYQWWADTGSSPTVMKLRNAANSAWITLFQLDGEWSLIPFENGTAAAPSIYFKDSGTDTGIYSPGADQVAITTGGTARLYVGSTGAVGIGTTAPTNSLEVAGTATSNLFAVKASSSGDCLGITARSAGNGAIVSALNSAQSDYEPLEINGELIYFQTRTGAGTVSERARIDSSGRLLVGTSTGSSTARLMVEGNTSDGLAGALDIQYGGTSPADGTNIGALRFKDRTSDTFYAAILCNADGATGAADKNGRLVFSTTPDGLSSPTERMRIQQDGNILIGRTSNQSIIHRLAVNADNYALGINLNGTTGECVRFYSAGTPVGSISITGSATAYNTSSDYRLKENVTAVTDGITRLQQLKPSRFNFIADPAKTVDGFLAHEVQTIVPEAITGEKDAVDDDGNPEYQGIDQSKLVPLLTAALQEAVTKIESLEARLTAAGL